MATPVNARWPDGLVYAVALSPNGSRVAVEFINASSNVSVPDVYTQSLDGGALSRLTFEGTNNQRPRWSRDGRDIFFLSDRSGLPALYRQRADGSAPAQRIASDPRGLGEGFESPDGNWLVLRSADEVCCDILGMRPTVDSALRPLVATQFRERSPRFAGRRARAYASDEGGPFEVFVRPFPDIQSGRFQISTAGGEAPRWSRQGDELFYIDDANDLQAVRVATRPSFGILESGDCFRERVLLFVLGPGVRRVARRPSLPDVACRLLLGAVPVSLVLVQNFLAELQQKVPR
jgi:hypothetical protein